MLLRKVGGTETRPDYSTHELGSTASVVVATRRLHFLLVVCSFVPKWPERQSCGWTRDKALLEVRWMAVTTG